MSITDTHDYAEIIEMDDFRLNRFLDEFSTLRWHETMFNDVEWYYAEERTYIIRIKARKDGDSSRPMQYRIVKAGNPNEAVSFACFDLSLKPKEEKK